MPKATSCARWGPWCLGVEGILVNDEDDAASVEGSVLYRPGDGELQRLEKVIVTDDQGAFVDGLEQVWAEVHHQRFVRPGYLGEEQIPANLTNHPGVQN